MIMISFVLRVNSTPIKLALFYFVAYFIVMRLGMILRSAMTLDVGFVLISHMTVTHEKSHILTGVTV